MGLVKSESHAGAKTDSVSFCLIFEYLQVLWGFLVRAFIVHPSECKMRALGKQSES